MRKSAALKKNRDINIKNIQIFILIAVFLVVGAVTVKIAFNAFAGNLPDGYVYKYVTGVYFGKSSGVVTKLEILSDENEFKSTNDPSEANSVKFADVSYPNVSYIYAYNSSGKPVARALTNGLDFTSQQYYGINQGINTSGFNLYVSDSDTWDPVVYEQSEIVAKGAVLYKAVGDDETELFSMSDLKMTTVYDQVLNVLGLSTDSNYQISYYIDMSNSVLASYNLKPSTAVQDLSFLMSSSNSIAIPMYLNTDDYYSYYNIPHYRYYLSSGESYDVINSTAIEWAPDFDNQNMIMYFTPYSPNTCTCNHTSIYDDCNIIQYGTYSYTTKFPVRIQLNYDLDGGQDSEDPPVDSLVETVASSEDNQISLDDSFTLNNGLTVFKYVDDGKMVLAKWRIGTGLELDAGAELLVGDNIQYANFQGIDADTGAVLYTYTANAVWSNLANLTYMPNCPHPSRYSDSEGKEYWDDSSSSFTEPYPLGETATVTSLTYSVTDGSYVFSGWSLDKEVPLLNSEYCDADGIRYTGFYTAGSSVSMDSNHILYGVWRLSDDCDYVTVEATVENGVFTSDESPDWAVPNGGRYFVAVSEGYVYFSCLPTGNNNAYYYEYYNGSETSGGGSIDAPLSTDIYTGRDSFYPFSFYNLTYTPGLELYLHVHYVRHGDRYLYFEPNYPENSQVQGDYFYTVSGLFGDTTYDLDKFATPQDDGSVELSGGEDDAVFSCQGYRFAGWSDTSDGTQKINSVTFDAESFYFVYALWDAKFPVIYYTDTNDDNEYERQEYEAGTEVTVGTSTDPSRSGYIFKGWKLVSPEDLNLENENSTFTMPSNTVTFVADWQADTYNVIYYTDTDKATVLETQTDKAYNDEVTVGLSESIANPTKEGYTFISWTSSDVEISDGKFNMPLKNVEMIPVWKANLHNVTYSVTNEGLTGYSLPEVKQYAYNTSVTVEPAISLNGYVFVGWNAPDGVEVNGGKFTMPDCDVTLSGTFVPREYTVEYEKNINDAVTGMPTNEVGLTLENGGFKMTEGVYRHSLSNEIPACTGYKFVGWSLSENSEECITTVSLGDFGSGAAIRVYAVWEKLYRVVYKDNGATAGTVPIDSGWYESDSYVNVMEQGTLARAGYTFNHWNTQQDNSGDRYSANTQIKIQNSDIILYAQWTPIPYRLEYNTGVTDGSSVESMPENVSNLSYEEIIQNGYVLSTQTPTRLGYEFAGWKVGNVSNATIAAFSDFNNDKYTAVATATWRAVNYTIFYTTDKTGVTDMPSNDVFTIEGFVSGVRTLNGTPKHNDYNFVGWSLDGTNVVSSVEFEQFASNNNTVNVIALWTPKDPDNVTVTYESGFTLAEAATGDVYGSRTFTAAYKADYTVLGNENDGASPYFIRTGYTFVGWKLTSAETAARASFIDQASNFFSGLVTALSTFGDDDVIYNKGDVFNALTQNLVFTAQWTPNEYTVNYSCNTSDEVSGMPDNETALTVTSDFTLTGGKYLHNLSTQEPTCVGYKFAGWSLSATSKDCVPTVDLTQFDADGSITVYAVWSKLYRVYYHADYATGSVPEDNNWYDAGNTVVISNSGNLAKTGYNFDCWNTLPDGTGDSYAGNASLIMQNADVNLYAQWSPQLYRLEYKTGATDSSTVASMPADVSNLTYDDIKDGYSLSTIQPARTGYNFAGWKVGEESNAATAEFSDFNNVQNTAVATAQWTPWDYTVVYTTDIANVSGMPDDDVFTIEDFVNDMRMLNGSPAHGDYNFAGWSLDGTTAITSVGYSEFTAENGYTVTVKALWILKDPDNVTVTYESGFTSADAVTGDVYGSRTFSAAYNANYTVLGNENDGASPYFVRTGYTFAGWKLTSAETATRASASAGGINSLNENVSTLSRFIAGDEIYNKGQIMQSLTQNITFTAQWTLNEYTVNYDQNTEETVNGMPENETGLTVESNFNKESGKYVYSLSTATLTRTGYRFIGWSLASNSADCVTKIDLSNFSYDNSVTVYAVWEKLYRIYYNINGATSGTNPTDVNWYASGAAAIAASQGTLGRTGHTFVCWNTRSDGSGTNYQPNDSVIIEDADITLFAQWKSLSYSLEYKTGATDSSTVASMPADVSNLTYDDIKDGYPLSTIQPVRTGYNFAGWKVGEESNAATAEFSDFNNVQNTAVATAQWTPWDYTVVYTTDIANVSGMPDDDVFTIEDFVNDMHMLNGSPAHGDYNFAGWSLDGTTAITSVGYSEFTAENGYTVTVKALWILKDPDSVSVTYESGFTSADAVTGDVYGSRTFSAAYNADYTVLGNENDGASPYFVRTGYTFAGWKLTSAETATNASVSTKINNSFSGFVTALSSLITGDEIYNKGQIIQSLTQNITFTAQWTPNVYAVNYSQNTNEAVTGMPDNETGLTVANDFTKKDDRYIRELSDAVLDRTGYKFLGWSLASNSTTCVTEVELTQFGNSNSVTVYAVWEKLYRVYYDKNGATTGTNPTDTNWYAPGSSAVAATQGTLGRIGYIFGGWNTLPDGGGINYQPNSNVTIYNADVTLYAQWTPMLYRLEYKTGVTDGSTVASMPADVSNLIYDNIKDGYSLSTIQPTRVGYTFTGWQVGSVSNVTSVAYNDFNNGTRTAVATAQWTENKYTLVYNPNSPTGVDSDVVMPVNSSVTVTYSQLAAGYVLGGVPTCENYGFEGWSKSIDGAVVTNITLSDLAADSEIINVYATWSENADTNKVYVVYRSGFTSVNPNDIWDGVYRYLVDKNQPYTVLGNESWYRREGYKFVGWVVTSAEGDVSAFSSIARLLGLSNIGDKISVGSVLWLDESLYLAADWEAIEYSVTYDRNGATSGTVPEDNNVYTVESGKNMATVLGSGDLALEGHEFVEWNTSPDGSGTHYSKGDAIEMKSDVVLYAIWREKLDGTYSVKYDKNGATSGTAPIDGNYYKEGDSVTVLGKGDLTNGSYKFKEWNTEKNGSGTGYSADDVFEMPANDVTLYAIWINSEGRVVSPGTGENSQGIIIALSAVLVSILAVASVYVLNIRRRKTV